MEKALDFIKNNKFNIIVAVIYLIVTAITMFHHEIWRDEAQAWCIVRDCNISEIITRARIEGHPLLWYMLLLPFAKLGIDVFSMQIISLLLVFAAVLYFLLKSPFDKITKILITFSAGMLYFLPIVARNYALIPLFVFMLAEIYPKRHEKPYIYALLIILLSNTHSLIWGFCIILFVLFVIESIQESIKEKRIKNLIPIIIIGLNFVYLFFMFYGITSQNKAIFRYSSLFHTKNTLLEAFLTYPASFLDVPDTLHPFIFYISLAFILFGLYKINYKMLILLLGSFAYSFYIYYYVWFNGIIYQKLFIFYLVIVFCYWVVYKNASKFISLGIIMLFALSCLLSGTSILQEIKYNFSSAKETAEFIKKNLPNEKIFYTDGHSFVYSPISAYLPDIKLYYWSKNKYISYHDFLLSGDNQAEEQPELKYIIMDELVPENNEYFDKIFSSKKQIISGTQDREVFRICKLKEL